MHDDDADQTAEHGAHLVPNSSNSSALAITFERGDEVEIGQVLLDMLGTELTYDEGAFHTYDPLSGVWLALKNELLESKVASLAGSTVLTPRAHALSLSHKKLTGSIRVARATLLASPELRVFSNAAPGVAFRNGFATVFHGEVLLDPHHPSHMAQHAFPFDYAPSMPHPKLDNFFAEVFADADPAEREQQIALCQEFLGTSLIGDATRYQRCLVLHGSGANGKSSFLEIAQSIFPPKAVRSLPPQDWCRHFSTASLLGALANLVNEIPENDIVASSTFKSVISGEPIQGERKFQDTFSFRARAGHIFAANSLPATNDQSQGFWRRFLIVPFSRDMEQAATHKRGVAAEIIQNERSAIIGWALEGAARVQRQGRYTEPASSRRLVAQWRRDADSVRLFLETECVVDPTKRISASTLYKAYKTWALDHGFRTVSLVGFGRRASQAGFKSTHTNAGSMYGLRLLQRSIL